MPTLETTFGTNVLVTRPARGLSKRRVKTVSAVLAGFDEVREAHLPDVIEIGATRPPQQVLFLVVDPPSALAAVSAAIDAELSRALGKYCPLIWPVTREHQLLESVRAADCVVGWRND